MIRVISDRWSWSGSSQRNAPITFFPFVFSACNWAIDRLSRDWSFETSKDHRASWSRFFTSAKNGQVSQIWIRQLYRLIPKGPTIWLLRGRRGDLVWLRIFFLQTPDDKFFPDKRRCKIFFSRIISHGIYIFSVYEILLPRFFLAARPNRHTTKRRDKLKGGIKVKMSDEELWRQWNNVLRD